MSLLPQHKKSADEIAKLRESLGIPGHLSDEEANPAETPSTQPVPDVLEISGSIHPKEMEKAASNLLAPLPLAEVHSAKPVRSLKRTERIPVLPIEEMALPEAPPAAAPEPLPVLHSPKPVRSLRKSEQVPLPSIQPPPPDSKLPIHRHSDKELNEIRRQEALALLAPAVHPQSLTAHRALVIPGYLFAAAGALCYYYYDLEIQITTGCVVAALLIAGFISLKKPLSQHHAAFISVMSLFVIVFGALHYFPQLSYGTFSHPLEEKSGTPKDL